MTARARVTSEGRDRHATGAVRRGPGLATREHEHGGRATTKSAAQAAGAVTENLPAIHCVTTDAIMIEVDSIDAALPPPTVGFRRIAPPKDAGDFRFVYVADPDGRPVMLIEKPPRPPAPATMRLSGNRPGRASPAPAAVVCWRRS
jgi:hypothetical protein